MKMRIPTDGEYDRLVALTYGSNDEIYWGRMATWIKSGMPWCNIPSKVRAVRGYYSARNWNDRNVLNRYESVGFRPAVEICEADTLGSDIQEGQFCVIGTLYMDGQPVKVPTNPTDTGDITAYIPGAKLEMRKAMDDPQYQVTGFRVGNALIADRALLNMISYEDIETALVCEPDCENMEIPAAMSVDTPLGAIVVKTATDSEHPGVYIDLRRKGCECDMPLALVEYCGDEGDKPDGEKNIITRVWGDAAQEGYTDRVVHEGIEDYFTSEEPVEYVVFATPGIAVQILTDFNARKQSHEWIIAQRRGRPENKVRISLSEGYNYLSPGYSQCYIIDLQDDVRPSNSKIYRTEAHTEESLVKLMTEILDGLK